jgi:hypothetical protein
MVVTRLTQPELVNKGLNPLPELNLPKVRLSVENRGVRRAPYWVNLVCPAGYRISE